MNRSPPPEMPDKYLFWLKIETPCAERSETEETILPLGWTSDTELIDRFEEWDSEMYLNPRHGTIEIHGEWFTFSGHTHVWEIRGILHGDIEDVDTGKSP